MSEAATKRVVSSRSTAETERLGERLGAALSGGEFIGLVGDLGAGKTAFVRGVARGLAVPPQAQVSSPTFAIVNAYAGGRLPLFHADLYRVQDAEELYDAGFYDLLGGDRVLLVEWLDRVPDVAPTDRLIITIEKLARGRRLHFDAKGAASALLEAFA